MPHLNDGQVEAECLE